jgi:hypothetical protein
MVTLSQDASGQGNTGWINISDLSNGTLGDALELGEWGHLRVKLQTAQLVVVEMEQECAPTVATSATASSSCYCV